VQVGRRLTPGWPRLRARALESCSRESDASACTRRHQAFALRGPRVDLAWVQRSEPIYDETPSDVAFNFDLRHYIEVSGGVCVKAGMSKVLLLTERPCYSCGRGLDNQSETITNNDRYRHPLGQSQHCH